MLHLATTLHILGLKLRDRAHDALTTDSERGSETMEKVLWAVAVIAIVAIVVAAITAFVQRESAKLT